MLSPNLNNSHSQVSDLGPLGTYEDFIGWDELYMTIQSGSSKVIKKFHVQLSWVWKLSCWLISRINSTFESSKACMDPEGGIGVLNPPPPLENYNYKFYRFLYRLAFGPPPPPPPWKKLDPPWKMLDPLFEKNPLINHCKTVK